MASSVSSAQSPIKTCEIHQMEKIDMFCKTCQLPYCVECIQENHQGHLWCKLSKIVKEKLSDAPRKCKDLRKVVIPKITEYLQDIKMSRAKLKMESAERVAHLNSHKEKIISTLNNCTDKMTEALENGHDEISQILDEAEDTLKKGKDEIESFAEILEERRSYTSEFAVWETHKNLDLKISQIIRPDVDNLLTQTQYIEGEINTKVLEVLLGNIQHGNEMDVELNITLTYRKEQPSITELSTFTTGDEKLLAVSPANNKTAWLHSSNSESVELHTSDGYIIRHLEVGMFFPDFAFLSDGDMVFTSYKSDCVYRTTPAGQTSLVVDLSPLHPMGICTTLSGDLLVTLETEDTITADQSNKCMVKLITLTNGQVKKTYQYENYNNEQQLFIRPSRVMQNFNTDICVIDFIGDKTGQLIIVYESGTVKRKYLGQQLKHPFCPIDIACDPNCNILLSDCGNHMIHLLHHSGQFLKYLNSETDGLQYPLSLGLDKQHLWVGSGKGKVKVYRYDF